MNRAVNRPWLTHVTPATAVPRFFSRIHRTFLKNVVRRGRGIEMMRGCSLASVSKLEINKVIRKCPQI